MFTLRACLLLAICPALTVRAAEVISSGTGFAVSREGLILTNAHVVKGCANLTVGISGTESTARVVASDEQNDLALLTVSTALVSSLQLRETARVQLGEQVIAFGYPLPGIMSTSLNVTVGNVSALAGLGDDTRSLQFTAPIQPGNSGGPLIDQSGNVVGVVTSKLSPLWAARNIGDLPQNVNFALKASVIRDFLDSRGFAHETKVSAAALPVTELSSRVSAAVFPLRCLGEPETTPKLNSIGRAESPQREIRPGVLVGGYGDAQFFPSMFLEVQNALTSYGVLVANTPSSTRQFNGDLPSIQGLLTLGAC